jgi:hypothetical protein
MRRCGMSSEAGIRNDVEFIPANEINLMAGVAPLAR